MKSKRPDHTENEGGFPKTTTWGPLIALCLTLSIWGISVTAPWGQDGRQAAISAKASSASSISNTAAQRTTATAKRGGLFADVHNAISALNPFSASSSTTSPSSVETRTFPSISAFTSDRSDANGHVPEADQSGPGGTPGFPAMPATTLLAAKISPDLKNIAPDKPVDVIVQFKSTPGSTDLTADGAAFKSDLPLIHAQLVTANGALLSTLAEHENVVYISPDRKLKGATNTVVTAVNADLANANGWNGTGVGVAVLDSGVNSVKDLNSGGNGSPSRVVYSQSFVPGYSSANDDYGHGTHISGIIAGNGFVSENLQTYPNTYQGIAPEANIIDFRVLDPTGAGTDSSVIAALQQAVALQSTYNIRVVNLSLARQIFESYTQDPLCQAVESAWQAGIVVVVSGGNYGEYYAAGTEGYGTIGAPGNDPYVITVGASNTHGTGSQAAQSMTSYSSRVPPFSITLSNQTWLRRAMQ